MARRVGGEPLRHHPPGRHHKARGLGQKPVGRFQFRRFQPQAEIPVLKAIDGVIHRVRNIDPALGVNGHIVEKPRARRGKPGDGPVAQVNGQKLVNIGYQKRIIGHRHALGRVQAVQPFALQQHAGVGYRGDVAVAVFFDWIAVDVGNIENFHCGIVGHRFRRLETSQTPGFGDNRHAAPGIAAVTAAK